MLTGVEEKTKLDSYYNAFINFENTRDFFIGFVDYMDFINTVPDIIKVMDKIRSEKKSLEKRKEACTIALLKKMAEIRKELTDYIAHKNIKDQTIEISLRDYDGWLDKKIVGSMSPAMGAYGRLNEVVMHLYDIPEHKSFALKYVEASPDKATFFHCLSLKEFDELNEVEHEESVGVETTRWGQLGRLSNLYDAIKRGKGEYKKLAEEQRKTQTIEGMWAIANLSILVGEWMMIEENEQREQYYFFVVEKVKPWIARLHNYITVETASQSPKSLKSIHLITDSMAAKDVIFVVLDERFEAPIRREARNNKGGDTFIKKLHNIAYFADAPDKKVSYEKNLASDINNGLFKIAQVAEYMKTNKLEKPTLVKKSRDNNLVLKNDIVVKTGLIRKDVPSQYQSLYIDKTK